MPIPPPMKSYDDFKRAVALRESTDNYAEENEFGYLGRYQFGMARLCDFGLTERIPGTKGFANKSFVWKAPFSTFRFLASRELQDACFDRHVASHRVQVLLNHQKWIGHELDGVKLTLSGIIACCHLLGPGGFIAFTQGDEAHDHDGFGTEAEEYLKLFSGYDIPASLPMASLKELERYVADPR